MEVPKVLFSKQSICLILTFLISILSTNSFASVTTTIVAIGFAHDSNQTMQPQVFFSDSFSCGGNTVSSVVFYLGPTASTSNETGSSAFANYSALLNAAQQSLTIVIDDSLFAWNPSYSACFYYKPNPSPNPSTLPFKILFQ